jgi:2-oxoglutarate dehydrogenase E1 component
LENARQKAKIDDTAIVRVEQPYPFPSRELSNIFAKYKNAKEICWTQEEPKNRGCWSFMESRVRELLPVGVTLCYFGRKEAASPATGSHHMHEVEEQEIMTQALDLAKRAPAATEEKAATAAPSTVETPTTVAK